MRTVGTGLLTLAVLGVSTTASTAQETNNRAVGAERIGQADSAPGTPLDNALTKPRIYSADIPDAELAPANPPAVQSGAEAFNIPSEVLYSWSGPYVGVRAGAALANGNTAFSGALEAGYDFNPTDRIVAGVEADIALRGDTSPLTDMPALGTITGRLGFLPTERVLLFGEAGGALGSVRGTTATGGTTTRLTPGFTLGAGAEFALNDTLTFVGEYTYTDLEDRTVPTGTDELRSSSFEAGIKFRF
ncbi:MAG: outer membrane beta-barrel protein [Pseudomonadota bacterium]